MSVNTKTANRPLPPKPTLTEQSGKLHSTVVGGSTAHVRLRCSASRMEEAKSPRTTNIWADRGTALHAVVENALVDDLSDAEVLRAWGGVAHKEGDMVHVIDLTPDLLQAKALPALKYFDEVVPRSAKFWIEQKFGMALRNDFDWLSDDDAKAVVEAGLEDIEGAFGTGDVFFADRDGRAGVIDWKFGDGWMVSAEDNDQMRFYLCLGIVSGLLPVQDEYEAHIFQPVEGGDWTTWTANAKAIYRLDDLVRFNNELADAIAAEPVYNAGEHCAKCNGRLTCQAFQDMLTTAVATDVATMSAEALGREMARLDAYAAYIKDVKAAALRNAQNGIHIPGYRLEAALGNSAWKDEQAAERALGRMGLDVKVRRVTKTISPTQALEQLKAIAAPDKEVARFRKRHIHRPDNGEKLVKQSKEEKSAGTTAQRLGAVTKALKARGL